MSPTSIAILGADHWHAAYVTDALAAMGDVSVVGVSDADITAAQRVASRFGARADVDAATLLEATPPDFAFVFGMPETAPGLARLAVERGIPCSVEKPVGVSAAAVRELARLSAERGAFVSVPFVFRLAGWARRAFEDVAAGGGPPIHASFRLIAGMLPGYAASGRGCATHVAAHFVDLYRYVGQTEVAKVKAQVSHGADSAIEDHATLLLSTQDGRPCTIEVGYTLPWGAPSLDFGATVGTARSYLRVGDGWWAEVDPAGAETRHEEPTLSRYFYAPYIRDALDRAAAGRDPLAGLADMEAVLRVVEAAYASAGDGAVVPVEGA